MKTCKKCKEEKSIDLFSPDKRNKDGKQSTCRLCCNLIRKEKYKNDNNYRIKQKEHQKKYSVKANERAKLHIKNLSDFYVIKELKRGTDLTTEDVKKYPELIELKRQTIINKRKCR